MIAKTNHEILDDDKVNSLTTETGMEGFSIDDYTIESAEIDGDNCAVRLSFQASGSPPEDRGHSGQRISGEAEAIIDVQGRIFYTVTSAELADDE